MSWSGLRGACLCLLLLGCTGTISGDDDPLLGADATPASADAALDASPPAAPCTEVVHIGDSLTAQAPEAMAAAYAAIPVSAEIDAFGGRAVLQKNEADPRTGLQAAEAFRAAGFTGCWVIALGTNDTANVAAGAGYTRAEAIDQMLTAIDPGQTARVMWVNTFTTLSDGFYQNGNMMLWNQALAEATGRWPNLQVYDWATFAATGAAPYNDGIHHTADGYQVRSGEIANALVSTFP